MLYSAHGTEDQRVVYCA